jgi:hypothetical protein
VGKGTVSKNLTNVQSLQQLRNFIAKGSFLLGKPNNISIASAG